MMYVVCNHHCRRHITIIIIILTVTAKIIQHQAQKMCLTLIMLPLFRNHHLNVVCPITVLYRYEIIRPFYIHQPIHCIKHKVPSQKKQWCVKHQHQCIIIWRLLTSHRRHCRCSHCTQMDHLVVNVWVHRHRLDSYHVSIAAVTVTQVLIL